MSLKRFTCFVFVVFKFLSITMGEDVSHMIVDNFSWKCANNASCVNYVATSVLNQFKNRESIDFGVLSVEPLPQKPVSIGRSSKVLDFLSGNAVRVPIGPMVFSVQRSDDYDSYVEIALLKKFAGQARDSKTNRGHLKDKKHIQVLIPMFLAANAVGWLMLAIKAVSVLTVKALLVSKLALLVAAGVIIKKLMDGATEKMMFPHYPEHHESPFVMPYNMEYAMPAHSLHGAELSASDLYSLHVPNPHEMQHAAMGSMGAESALSHAIEIQNITQQQQLQQHQQQQHQQQQQQQQQLLAGLQNAGITKVKREDAQWTGVKQKPLVYNYMSSKTPVYVYRKI